MDKNKMLVLTLANVSTIITVLIGTILNNGPLNGLNSRFSRLETRFGGLEQSKVIDLDNRLTRIEAQRH